MDPNAFEKAIRIYVEVRISVAYAFESLFVFELPGLELASHAFDDTLRGPLHKAGLGSGSELGCNSRHGAHALLIQFIPLAS